LILARKLPDCIELVINLRGKKKFSRAAFRALKKIFERVDNRRAI
jgi:hypothetical protein